MISVLFTRKNVNVPDIQEMQELGQPPKELVGQGVEVGGMPPLPAGAQDQCTIS